MFVPFLQGTNKTYQPLVFIKQLFYLPIYHISSTTNSYAVATPQLICLICLSYRVYLPPVASTHSDIIISRHSICQVFFTVYLHMAIHPVFARINIMPVYINIFINDILRTQILYNHSQF